MGPFKKSNAKKKKGGKKKVGRKKTATKPPTEKGLLDAQPIADKAAKYKWDAKKRSVSKIKKKKRKKRRVVPKTRKRS